MSTEIIKTISTREVYRNPWTTVREDVIERSNGQRGIYGVVDKDPACIILPIEHTSAGDFIWLVRQFRYTVGGTYYELPQGGWEQPDVDPLDMANGELREETGLRADANDRTCAPVDRLRSHAPASSRLSRRRSYPG